MATRMVRKQAVKKPTRSKLAQEMRTKWNILRHAHPGILEFKAEFPGNQVKVSLGKEGESPGETEADLASMVVEMFREPTHPLVAHRLSTKDNSVAYLILRDGTVLKREDRSFGKWVSRVISFQELPDAEALCEDIKKVSRDKGITAAQDLLKSLLATVPGNPQLKERKIQELTEGKSWQDLIEMLCSTLGRRIALLVGQKPAP